MGKKEDTPLQATVKRDDELKKTIEKAIKTGEAQLKKKGIEAKEKKELYESLKQQEKELEAQIEKINELDLEDEPSMKENKFNSKKTDEVKKLNTVKEKLTKLQAKAKPEDAEDEESEEEDEEEDSLGEVTDEEEESGEEEEEDESEEDEDGADAKKKVPVPKKRGKKDEKKSPPPKAAAKEEEDDDEEEESEEEESEDDESEVEAKVKPPTPKARVTKETAPQAKAAAKPTKKPEVEESEEEEEDDDEEESEEEESEEDEKTEPKNKTPTPRRRTDVKKSAAKAPQSEEDDEEEESEEEESEEDEESEEEESEDEKDGTLKHPRKYEALVTFSAEQEGDLSFQEGEVLTVLAHSADGWLTAQNSKGEKGVVPITYLKDLERGRDEDSEEDEDESEDSEEDSENEDASPRVKTPRSGKMLWKNIKQAVKEESATDFLLAMGAVPGGFRDSTLGMARTKEEHFTMKAHMAPKLSPSCLAFRDLHLDKNTSKIRPHAVKVQRIVQISMAKQIPAPGTGADKEKAGGLEIKSRHIRVCLFDGKNMMSNIHTVRVSSVDKSHSTWNFNHKVTDAMKSLEFGEFFIRSNSNNSDLGVLFELCMSYTRTSSGQSGEFSCGWMFQPLFDKDGKPIENKQFDEVVNGGTPFEQGVDVDPSLGRKDDKAQTSLFRGLMSSGKQPRLVVRFQAPSKEQTELLNTLPETIISSTTYITYLSYYRHLLVDALIKDNDDIQSTEPIHSPLLTTFPEVLDQPDLMDILRGAWKKNLKKVDKGGKRGSIISLFEEKKDPQALKEYFRRVFMEHVYPIYHTVSTPGFRLADQELEAKRAAEIQRLSNLNTSKKFLAASLLSADATHKPFDVRELAFGVIGPHCVTHRIL